MRKSPLKPSTYQLQRKPIRRRSKKMQAAYDGPDGRKAFVKWYLGIWRECKVQWENCTGKSEDVHEWWSRGTGGAIVPGPKEIRQGQRFIPVCRNCHGELDLQPERAKEQGWVRRVGRSSIQSPA